jgi:sugar phosphate isomerase/epimerase
VKLATPGGPHLTYCTNIHPGETWAEVRANLERFVRAVKASVAPDRPFGVGLRLSAEAAATLAGPAELEAFRAFLRESDLYVFTINGFPYGVFHGTRVKEDVYLPDWLDDARLHYSDRLAELLAALLPDEPGLEGTVSTVPGAYKARVRGAADADRMAELMLRHAAGLHRLRERTGKTVSLALEPEPSCHLETVDETVRFFEGHLFGAGGVATFGRLAGLGRGESEAALRRHLGVCFDACHMAVEFEDAAAGLVALRTSGIRVGKVQVSAGLRVRMDPGDRALLDALRPFAEGVYLHQVVERRAGRLVRYLDLPEALEAAARNGGGLREWRIHFHVPLFREELGRFASTQDYLRGVLGLLRQEAHTPHLEVETYTWDVLPEAYRRESIVAAVARELRWVLAELGVRL